MSVPSSTSRLIVEASSSSLKGRTGRRFAYSSSSLRRRKSAFSGCFFELGPSKRGTPPTAPNKIASLFWQSAIVASEIASPSASIAATPTRACVRLKVCPNLLPTLCKTLTACSTTSGPMPSPGNTTIEYVPTSKSPWAMPRLYSIDFFMNRMVVLLY